MWKLQGRGKAPLVRITPKRVVSSRFTPGRLFGRVLGQGRWARHCIAALGSALLLSFGVVAQPLKLQLAAAHNDKLQKHHRPYQRAVAEQLGQRFWKAHAPFAERRRTCRWDGEWAECGYLRLSHASILRGADQATVMHLMRDPCGSMGSTQDPGLRQLCASSTFTATDVRVAEARQLGDSGAEPDSARDEIGFEARIRPNKTTNSQKGKK